MSVVTPLGWLIVLASVATGVASFSLVWYLRRHRGRPGAGWFMVSLSAQAVWALAYGVGLLVPELPLRAHAEALSWIGMNWVGPFFLAFALEYTGRTRVTRNQWLPVVLISPIVTTALGLTHQVHSLLWQGFRIDPVFGLATAQYAIQPLGYATVITSLTLAGIGVLLIVETVFAYGPLYRREAVAVALSPLPATVPLLVWLGQIGPWPALNLTPALLVSHVLLDAYAFTGTHMFETNPVTRRAAKETAVDGLRDPLLVLDPAARVVKLNDRAQELFGMGETDLPVSVDALTGKTLTELRDRGRLESADGAVYAVSYTPLSEGAAGGGSIVVLYDITVEETQRQQLSVFNRVLRHNLRNEMTVVRGHGKSIRTQAEEPQLGSQADSIVDASDRLLSIAEKIRAFQQVRDGRRQSVAVEVTDFLRQLRTDLIERYPDADITIDSRDGDSQLRTDPDVLEQAVGNLVENAVCHGDDQRAEITVQVDGSTAVFQIRDHNDPIPDIETESLQTGQEDPLQHGKGVGLWIASWAVAALDGTLTFDYEDGNVVTVEIPHW